MIRVIVDSASSIPADSPYRDQVEILTLYVNKDGEEYEDATMDLDAFYADIASMVNSIPTTSQPSQHSFVDAFTRAAEAGDEVLGLFISSGLSGCYEGAVRAARSVAADHPGFTFRLIDTTSCGADEAFPIYEGVDAVREGKSLDECAQAVLDAISCTRFLFTPDNLAFLKAGGRIGGAAALLGGLVQISPILTVRDTFATTFAKVRTRPKALARILSQMKSDAEACGGLKRVVVHYIGDKTDAVRWAAEAVEPLVGKAVSVIPVSPIIGVHVGPATGIVYECFKPIEGKLTQDSTQYLCAH